MPRYILPQRKSRSFTVVGIGGGLVVGAVGGFLAGRAFPDRQVIEQQVQMALRSKQDASPQLVGGVGPTSGSPPRSGPVKVALADDLRVSLRQIFAITEPTRRIEAIRALVGDLPRDRWIEFFEAIEKMGDDQEFEDNPNSLLVALGTFETVINEIATQAPEVFLRDWIAKAPTKVTEDAFGGVLRSWAARDIAAAVAFFDRTIRPLIPEGQGKLPGQLAREFVKKDADAAFAWIKTLPTDKQGEAAREAFQTLSHVDSAKAASILVARDEIPNRAEVAAAIAAGWGRTEPAKAFKWAASLPTALSRDALSAATEQWAMQDYGKTLESVAQLDPEVRAGCLPSLATHAPDSEIPSFAAHLRSQPESDNRTAAANTLLGRWAEKDPTTASQWLAEEPAGPTRDAAIKGFANQLLDTDPASAFEWAAVMANPDDRSMFLDSGIKQWAEKDPAAARQWVLTSQRLSTDDREKLLVRTGR